VRTVVRLRLRPEHYNLVRFEFAFCTIALYDRRGNDPNILLSLRLEIEFADVTITNNLY
jgi:hypothetical protein